MRRNPARLVVMLALFGGWTLWQRGCSAPKPDIEVGGGAVLVRNQTPDDWLDVRIWLNDYYAGTAAEITAGAFVREPVARFIAGQGQGLSASTAITSVVVLGHTRAGAPVRVAWGKPAWH